MASYRMLEDHYVNGYYFAAGTTQSTADVGGLLPTAWKPTLNVDPLDTAAVTAFHAQPPGLPGLIQQQFQTQSVSAPTTHWVASFNANGGPTRWSLTGLGANLSAVYS